MNWIKKGLLFSQNKQNNYLLSHAALPFIEKLYDDIFRIYFSSRDKNNFSHTSFIEIDINYPKKILRFSPNPIISPGPLGSFDDSGSMGSWIVSKNNKKYLYYIGWNRRNSVPYHNSIGVAVSVDGKNFTKYAEGPIIDRTPLEPYFSSSPCVLLENNIWKMWYLSGTQWSIVENLPRPKYNIRYAESKDGLIWNRNFKICIDFKNEKEWAISRPCILKENGIYKMWYSYTEEKSYRIGYAESIDNKNWKRMDNLVGIDISSSGWDSCSIEYPFVFQHNDEKYMLYNGNEYGKTGFGLAVLEN
jgi:predicted GH43/DUF377 family glycosyl hydrolase